MSLRFGPGILNFVSVLTCKPLLFIVSIKLAYWTRIAQIVYEAVTFFREGCAEDGTEATWSVRIRTRRAETAVKPKRSMADGHNPSPQ
jgi:hypothetical protein